MPYWLDWQKKNTTHQLTEEHRSLLMRRDEVVNVRDWDRAFDLSREKWQRILRFLKHLEGEPLPLRLLEDFSEYIGFSTCGLCHFATERHLSTKGSIRFGNDKCNMCPLSNINECPKDGSIFTRIETICLTNYLEATPADEKEVLGELGALAAAMLRNLEQARVTQSRGQ